MTDVVELNDWITVCCLHRRPARLLCNRCHRPLCIGCAQLFTGTGYICADCKAEMRNHFSKV